VFNGGDGIDTVDLSGRTTGQTVDLSGAGFMAVENLTGSAVADTLTGTTGANLLLGGTGADSLQGTDGDAQGFRYNSAGEAGDTINFFESGTDRIEVSDGGFGVTSIVDGQNFFAAAPGGPLAGPAFLFDAGTATLSYDSDGDGGAQAVALVTLQTGGMLQATDLLVF
jgi:Ca2+-binding RTX toxin-like protein